MASRLRRSDWPTAVASVAALAALVTAVYTCQMVRGAQFALGVTTLENLEQEFEGARMHHARRTAARALLRGDATASDVNQVLDFFETVGLLVRRGAIDAEMAWNTFYYGIDGYGRATEDMRRHEQARHPQEWTEFEALRAGLDKIEARKKGDAPALSPEELHDFLSDESTLK
jgi:hypothetical protein